MRMLIAALAATLALAAGCAAPTPAADAHVVRPRLVVVFIVDGLPQRQVVDYRDQLAPDGLRRFLDKGTWFANAHHGHSLTVTAAGHATVLTGAYPDRHGIIANEWRDPRTGELEYCASDTSATYIGHKTHRLDGTSPKNLKVETVGDVLRRANPASRVISVSGKDRGAILPGGKSGIAYMYQAQTGEFSSTTYYMPAHPAWVDAFNRDKPADRYFHVEWKPLLDQAAYARSLADEQPWYLAGGKLPKVMGQGQDKAGPLFYGSLLASPFIDQLTLDFARAAVAGEGLGKDDAPDILVLSLSGHDYVNHAYSAESRLSHDHLLRLDRMFEAFFRYLDATVGDGHYLVVLTADHGFTPLPEVSQALGRDAGRFSPRPALAKVQAGLAKRFGEGRWLLGFSADSLVLNQPLALERKVDVDALAEETRRLLIAEPGVAAIYTRAELESGSRAGAPLFTQMRRSWNRELSGDLQMALKPYWIFSSGSGNATTHGSPNPDDTHVPILFYGPSWMKPGRVDTHVEVVDIAPTLAAMLGIPAPAASEGKVLPLR